MRKIINIFFIVVYIIPFAFTNQNYWISFGFFLILINLIFFLVGLNYFKSSNSLFVLNSKIEISSFSFFIIFFLFCIVTNFNLLKIFLSLFDGSYLVNGLEQAKDRYNIGEGSSLTDKVATVFFFLYSFCLGTLNKNSKLKILFSLFYLVMVVYFLSSLARAGVFISIVAISATLIINNRFYLNNVSVLKILKFFLISFLILMSVFLIPAYGRVQYDDKIVEILFFKLGEYTIAMYEALLIWIKSYSFTEITFGKNTFTFIFKLFGYKVPQGFYTEVVDTRFGETVIFTIFRGLIQDFSVFSIFIFYFLGISISYISSKVFFSKWNLVIPFSCLCFVLFPFVSVYSVSTFVFSILLFFLIFKVKIYVG